MEWNKFADSVHRNAVEHGWWDEPRSFGEVACLIHSELSEALEEARVGRPMAYVVKGRDKASFEESILYCDTNPDRWDGEKPEGIAVELCDAVIRVLDWFGYVGADFDVYYHESAFCDYGEEMKTIPLCDMLAEAHHRVSLAYGFRDDMTREHQLAAMVHIIVIWMEENDIQWELLMEKKHEYNKTRPYRHNKLF